MKTTGGPLGPGAQIVVELLLSRHLDLSLPGHYTIAASRKPITNASDRSPVVTSNVASFEVID